MGIGVLRPYPVPVRMQMPAHRYSLVKEGPNRLPNHVFLPLYIFSAFFDRIASHVPISSVIALSRTHSSLMPKLETHLRYSFDNLLASRVPKASIVGFKTLLLDTRAVISGSTALHFLLRDTHWKPGDFDVYAPFGTGYTVAKWLTDHAGYRMISDGSRNFSFRPHMVALPRGNIHEEDLGFVTARHNIRIPRPDKPHYEMPGSNIYRVFKLCKGASTFVDVIESSQLSFLPSILQFHSTLVMNYLTPESLVVLYPALTLRREGVLQYREASTLEEYDPPADHAVLQKDPKGQNYVIKYGARGFTLSPTTSSFRRPCGAACPALERTIFEKVDEWALELKFALSASSARIENGPTHASGSRPIGESGPDCRSSDDALSINLSPAQNLGDLQLTSPLLNPTQLNIDSGRCNSITSTGEFEPQGPMIGKIVRPPLPATSWSLRAPPRSMKNKNFVMCTNKLCHQQGCGPTTVVPSSRSGG
ncbi:hypothetical protein BDZ94DRAFT_1261854 [Collybia nuda]|uniref:Uncharacterized protein n=1 Tax=Collybia nuda TaxID=64659 RepID=A0A9P5Y4S5_9AGAR|nr:hypothetical protein BDZ94DRAFT_1261854 [Collybia nuda]